MSDNRCTPIRKGAIMYGFSKYGSQERYDEWNTTQVKLKLKPSYGRRLPGAIHDCFPIGTGRAGPAARLAGGAWNK